MARILLGVSGGISAYKAVELVRLGTKAGHAVRVIQTPASLHFVGRATFEGVTGAPVLVEEWEPDPARGAFPGDPPADHDPIAHLELVRRCDVLCVAPASANTVAKLAAGLADNLLTSAALASTAPLVLAPAMNNHMYEHPATQANLETLRARGATVVPPGTGALASRGEWGVGRLAEPATVLAAVEAALPGAPAYAPRSLDGLRVLVTAGGTREPIDAVRFVGNRSSGRMGFAVADFGAVAATEPKIKKEGRDGLTLSFEPTADVLQALSKLRRPGQTLVGFAAEHGDGGREEARAKLERKGLDAIVLNDVARADIGFEVADNEVVILTAAGERAVPRGPKSAIAAAVIDEVEGLRARASEEATARVGGP